MEKWTIELKYRSGLHNLSVPLLLPSQPRRIYHASYVYVSYPIYPIGSNASSSLSIDNTLSFRSDTSPTFLQHHSRIIFGLLVRVVGQLSDAMELGQQQNWCHR